MMWFAKGLVKVMFNQDTNNRECLYDTQITNPGSLKDTYFLPGLKKNRSKERNHDGIEESRHLKMLEELCKQNINTIKIIVLNYVTRAWLVCYLNIKVSWA